MAPDGDVELDLVVGVVERRGEVVGGLEDAVLIAEVLVDPNDFIVLQDRLFANFNTVSIRLLLLSLLVIAVVGIWVWRQRHVLDVLALGREVAINLGVDYQRSVMGVLVVIAVLVSVMGLNSIAAAGAIRDGFT